MAGVNAKTTSIIPLLQNEEQNQLEKVAGFYDGNNNLIEEYKTFPQAVIGDVALGRTFNYDGSNNLIGSTAFVSQWTSVYQAAATAPISDIILDNNTIIPGQPIGTLVGSFTPVGGVGPFNWSLISNPGTLFGLQNGNELITAQVLTAGSYPITVLVTDSVGQFAVKNFTVEVVLFLNDFSLAFNGDDEFVNFGTTADVQFDTADPFSFSCWVRKINTTGTQILMQNNGTGTNLNNPGIVMHWDSNSDNRILIHLNNSGSNQIRVRGEIGSSNLDEYVNLVFAYDGTGLASGVNIFLNGVALTLTVLEDGLGGNSIQSTDPWTMAAQENGVQAYLGFVDEPAFWNIALNATQAAEIYNSGTPDDLFVHSANANLIHWWRNGDGDTFPTIQDQVASLDGTMTNMEASDIIGVVP